MKHLESAREVISALGGLDAVAALTGRKYVTVSAWQTRFDSFPPELFALMTEELEKIEVTAPKSLWRQVEGVPSDDEIQEQEAADV